MTKYEQIPTRKSCDYSYHDKIELIDNDKKYLNNKIENLKRGDNIFIKNPKTGKKNMSKVHQINFVNEKISTINVKNGEEILSLRNVNDIWSVVDTNENRILELP